MFKDKTLLITGGTGSFGNAVIKKFLDKRIISRKKAQTTRKKEERISHRPTPNSALRATHGRQTHTDIYPADIAE